MGFLGHALLSTGLALNIAWACHAGANPTRGDTNNNNTSGRNLLKGEYADYVRDSMEFWKIPGMAIAVVDNNDVFTETYGYSALPDKKVTPDTLFYAGSTTKAQTAACLAILINQNKKNKTYSALADGWKTSISSILKDDFVLQDEWATKHMTLDDAVSHRTGLPRHDRALRRETNGVPLSTAEIVRAMRNLPYPHEPRTDFYYNNHMYVTLSHVIETVTKKSLKQVMKELIWNPLGMNTTYFGLEDAKNSQRDLAKGYVWINQTGQLNGTGKGVDAGYFKETTYMPLTDLSGAGAVISNVRDYAQWIRGLLNQTAAFNNDVLKDIRAPRFLTDTTIRNSTDVILYGLGWYRSQMKGRVFYRHDGTMIGFKAQIYLFPDDKFGFVMFTNSDHAASSNTDLSLKLISKKFGIPENDLWNFTMNRSGRTTSDQDFKKAVDRHYPNRTTSTPSFSIKDMEGTYVDPGYGTLNLRAGQINSNETVLVAERRDMTWDYGFTFRHMFGDSWIAAEGWMDDINQAGQFHPVEFVKGNDGKPAALKMRVMADYVPEGNITFNKMA